MDLPIAVAEKLLRTPRLRGGAVGEDIIDHINRVTGVAANVGGRVRTSLDFSYEAAPFGSLSFFSCSF